MTIKTYEAPNTIISDLCIFVNGKPRRVNFSVISVYEGSHTGKGSMLTTGDEALQEALESCPAYGKQFMLYKEEEVSEIVNEVGADAHSDNIEMVHVGADVVSSPNDARDYLLKNFGVEKKKLPNLKAIVRAAAENGVVFDSI